MFPLRPKIVPYAVELSFEEACDLEILVIGDLKRAGHALLNISNGGEVPMRGRRHSEETKRKIGFSSKGRTAWNKGKKHSLQTKEKISAALRGERNPFFGKRHSQEVREKITATRRANGAY